MDKRSSKRIPHRKTVRYGINGPENMGYTFNIARDGISIESPRIYGRGTKINIYIKTGKENLDDSYREETLQFEGVISWASHSLPGRPSKMGIKFKNPDKFKQIYEEKSSRYKGSK
jgi:hypothetical protein